MAEASGGSSVRGPSGAPGRPRPWAESSLILALAGSYFAAGKLGLELAFVHASATAVWAPTGITLAAFLLFGYRLWPGAFLGAYLVNVTTEGNVATSLGVAVANTLEGLVGAYLVNRFAGGRTAFDASRNVVKFVALAGIVATTVSATLGFTSLALGGFAAWGEFETVWLTWWLGDAAGAVIVAPFLVVWGNAWGRRGPTPLANPWRGVEALSLAAGIVGASYLVFLGGSPPRLGESPFEILVLPLVVWGAYRFEQRGATTVTLALSGLAIWGTLQHLGPFVRPTANDSLLLLQAFMGTVAATSLILAALVRERRLAQESIARARDELDRRVQERTADLQQALDELQAFSYSISHDLRGPLRAIDGYAHELVEEHAERLGPEGRRKLERLKAVNRHMADLIESLLKLSRLSRSELRMEPVDLSALARSVEANLRKQDPGRRVEFRVGDGLAGRGDARMLELVLENLLGNAWKFTRGRDEARIEFGRTRRDGESVYYVRDNGAGFDPRHASKLFQPFTRLHTEAEFEGTGIGLVITRRILQRHGGRIWAEAAPGLGASFFFTLGG